MSKNVLEDTTEKKVHVKDVKKETVLNVLDITPVPNVTEKPPWKTELVLKIVEKDIKKEVDIVKRKVPWKKTQSKRSKWKKTKKTESKEIIKDNNSQMVYTFPEPLSYLTLLDPWEDYGQKPTSMLTLSWTDVSKFPEKELFILNGVLTEMKPTERKKC